jgi:hypothetical protein
VSHRIAVWAAVGAVALAGGAFSGCDILGGDGEETVATTPTTTGTEATGTAAPPAVAGEGSTVPEGGGTEPPSGGTGAPQDYDPEQDVPGNDIPPPPGSPQAQFEQECAQNPEIC